MPHTADPATAWRDDALAADVLFVIEPGSAGAAGRALRPGLGFGDWMGGSHGGRRPSAEDLEYHLTTLFPPIRPKGWLVLRFLDLLPAGLRETAVLRWPSPPTSPSATCGACPTPAAPGTRAARHGLDDPLLGPAALRLLGLVDERVGRVSDDLGHRALVAGIRARIEEHRSATRHGCRGSEVLVRFAH